jgi:hypothetical protein
MSGAVASLLQRTFRDPQGAARALLDAGYPTEARWTAVALVAVLALIGLNLALWVVPEAGPGVFTALAQVWPGLGIQLASIVLLAALMVGAGRVQGGQGRFPDALVLVTWIEFVMVLGQAVQIVAMLVLPALSLLISVGSLFLFVWLMTHFTAALHRLPSLGRVLMALMVGFVGVLVLAAIILGALGIVPEPTGV